MSNADEIRRSVERRIAELEAELRKLKAAHVALMAGAGTSSADQAPHGDPRRVDPTVREGHSEVPRAVVRVFERWMLMAVVPRPLLCDSVNAGWWRCPVRRGWGGSVTSVGVIRAQSAIGLGVGRLGSALLAARDAMRTGGPLDGYAALAGPHRVKGLGPSFGSKFLHFVSPQDRGALILDQLVADWLAREADLSLNAKRWSVRTYTAYLSPMHAWSSGLGISSLQLEEIIFAEEATQRGLAAWAAR